MHYFNSLQPLLVKMRRMAADIKVGLTVTTFFKYREFQGNKGLLRLQTQVRNCEKTDCMSPENTISIFQREKKNYFMFLIKGLFYSISSRHNNVDSLQHLSNGWVGIY